MSFQGAHAAKPFGVEAWHSSGLLQCPPELSKKMSGTPNPFPKMIPKHFQNLSYINYHSGTIRIIIRNPFGGAETILISGTIPYSLRNLFRLSETTPVFTLSHTYATSTQQIKDSLSV